MACEERAAVKWEFNAGGVRNGLAQQCQEAASRERGLIITAERLHVSCAMKDLGEEIQKYRLKVWCGFFFFFLVLLSKDLKS